MDLATTTECGAF